MTRRVVVYGAICHQIPNFTENTGIYFVKRAMKGVMMSKFLVFLADGCEDVEALTVVDYLRRAEVEVDTVSVMDTTDTTTKSNIVLKADKAFDEISPEDYDGLYIPGGTKGAETLRDDDRVIEIIKDFDKDEKIIAAICAGPIVLNRAGVLADKKATSFPAMREDLDNVGQYIDDQIVVTDGNITTSRGAATTVYLAMRLVEILKGADAVAELQKGTQQVAVESYYNISYDYISK